MFTNIRKVTVGIYLFTLFFPVLFYINNKGKKPVKRLVNVLSNGSMN